MKQLFWSLIFVLPNFLFAQSIGVQTSRVETRVVFRPGFKQKYKTPDFDYSEEVINPTWWDDFKYWLANVIRDLFNYSEKDFTVDNVENIFYVLAIIVLAIVVFFLIRAYIKGESTWLFNRKHKSLSIISSEEEDIHLINFNQLISEAIAKEDYRSAIRYYYLWLLKNYSEKQIIQWHPEKTNSDYTYEIKDSSTRKKFKQLSYLYTYIWYGEFEIDTPTFEVAQTSFKTEIKATNE